MILPMRILKKNISIQLELIPQIGVLAFLIYLSLATFLPKTSLSSEFVVYSVFKNLDLGMGGEKPQKDFYVNMGSQNGLREGSQLEVLRKVSSYDLRTEKLYKDMIFPIAQMKVIHVENNAAICRLEKMLPAEKVPALSPRMVMVGDVVRATR